jgi:peptidyl-Lys metalloendopeptidase
MMFRHHADRAARPVVPRDAEDRPMKTARLLALALPLLLAVPAGAQPLPTSKPPPAEASPATIPGPVCTPEHRRFIDTAWAEAQQRIAEAIRFVRANPEHEHIRRWFGTTPVETVRNRLERTAERLRTTDNLKLACNHPQECRTNFAYAFPRVSMLGLCPAFFRARGEGQDSRWGILIHEASHIAAGTDDHAYGPHDSLVLAKRDPARAAANADSYEYFVETMPR